MVTTNCITGEANYFEEKKDSSRVIDIVRASSSLPFVCPITYVDEVPMLDGGIVDSIPLQRAIADGCTRNVVILTRNRGYRKDSKDIRIPSFVYRKYPKLREALVAGVLFIMNSWKWWNAWRMRERLSLSVL